MGINPDVRYEGYYEKIKNVLSGKALQPREIEKITGINRTTLNRRLREMLEGGMIEYSIRGNRYSPFKLCGEYIKNVKIHYNKTGKCIPIRCQARKNDFIPTAECCEGGIPGCEGCEHATRFI